MSKIQEASLSDFQIRDLNDEINKLMREKHMWEVQIRGLGGPNYMRGGGRVVDDEGREIEGAGRGYRFVFWVVFLLSLGFFLKREGEVGGKGSSGGFFQIHYFNFQPLPHT